MQKHLQVVPEVICVLCILLTACGGGIVNSSKLERDPNPIVENQDLKALVSGNTSFAFDLFHAIRTSEGNQVFSPYSISLAFAMAYGGASGETADQMANVMHYTLPSDRLHTGFNALDLDLAKRPDQAVGVDEEDRFELTIANSMWGQRDWPFLPGYLDLLATNYGAGMRLVNFENDPEDARQRINSWVSDQTMKRITDIIPQGAIDSKTRLVLANAIYFKATWKYEFSANSTSQQPFQLVNGETITVPMMVKNSLSLGYASGDGWQAVSLPYKGGVADMLIVLPEAGEFEQLQSILGVTLYDEIVSQLQPQMVDLSLPKFTFETPLSLSSILKGMGMESAFDVNIADFSGMDTQHRLFITNALHKAFIAVDEKGTEAAAVTAITMAPASLPPEAIKLLIDRPFIFAIRDIPTGTILFLGRVLDPR